MKKLWPSFLVLLAATGFGVWAMPKLPSQVVIHWGASGEPNGWASPLFAVFLVPVLGLFIAGVLMIAPRLDPKRINFAMHASSYWLVANVVLVFLALTHVMVIGISIGWPIEPARVIGSGIGVVFVVMGNLFSRIRPNWVFGIRTPWTLSSEVSWRETHRYGGYAFVISGITVFVCGLLWPNALFTVLVATISCATIFSIMWSYLAWKRDPLAGGAS